MSRYGTEKKSHGFAVKDTRSNEILHETYGPSPKNVEQRFLRMREIQIMPSTFKIVPVRLMEYSE